MKSKWIRVLIHASTWFAPILVPLIIFFIASEQYLKRLSIQAILFHVSMLIGFAISGFLSSIFILAIIGFPLGIIFGLTSFIVPIIGIVRSIQNKPFEYPLFKHIV